MCWVRFEWTIFCQSHKIFSGSKTLLVNQPCRKLTLRKDDLQKVAWGWPILVRAYLYMYTHLIFCWHPLLTPFRQPCRCRLFLGEKTEGNGPTASVFWCTSVWARRGITFPIPTLRLRMLGLSEKPAGAPSGGGLTAGANVKITGGNYKVPWEETHGGKLWKRVIFFCCKIQNMYTDKLRR